MCAPTVDTIQDPQEPYEEDEVGRRALAALAATVAEEPRFPVCFMCGDTSRPGRLAIPPFFEGVICFSCNDARQQQPQVLSNDLFALVGEYEGLGDAVTADVMRTFAEVVRSAERNIAAELIAQRQDLVRDERLRRECRRVARRQVLRANARRSIRRANARRAVRRAARRL